MQQQHKASIFASVFTAAVIAVAALVHPSGSGILNLVAPEKAAVGELVILDATKSTATSFRWIIIPETPNFLVIEGGKRAVFSEGHPGIYQIYLAGANGGEVDSLVQPITVGDAPGPGPNPPGPVPPPQPVDIGAKIKGWVGLVKSPTVATEAKALAGSFKSVASQIKAGVLTTDDIIIKSTAVANNGALGSASTAWTPFFTELKTELNARSKAGTLKGPDQHAALWTDIGAGLENAVK